MFGPLLTQWISELYFTSDPHSHSNCTMKKWWSHFFGYSHPQCYFFDVLYLALACYPYHHTNEYKCHILLFLSWNKERVGERGLEPASLATQRYSRAVWFTLCAWCFASMHVSYVSTWFLSRPKEGASLTGTGVTDRPQLPDVKTGKWAVVLHKNSKCS